MGYLFGQLSSGSGGGGGGGGTLTGYVAALVPAGSTDAFDPGGGFPGTVGSPIGRLDLDPSLGNATLQGLKAGLDGQLLLVRNTDAVNTLALSGAGSGTAGDSFATEGALDATLNPGASILLCYYGATTGVDAWVVVS